MKAALYRKYGQPEVIQIVDIEKPIPKEDEILIKVKASSINAYDYHAMSADTFMVRLSAGLFKPKNQILGTDVSGVIEQTGKNVTKFKVGDEVYGCLDSTGSGGYADYVCTKEKTLSLKTKNMSFEQAAAIPMAAVTALQGLVKEGNIKKGDKVLINGASGGVGLFAIQLAKYFESEVTAVCSSKNVDIAIKNGADYVIDYNKDNFLENKNKYDLIIDIAANINMKEIKNVLKNDGTCVVIGFKSFFRMLNVVLFGSKYFKSEGKKFKMLMADNSNGDDLIFINELFDNNKILPQIDKVFSLNETSKAFKYYLENSPKGKIIIKT